MTTESTTTTPPAREGTLRHLGTALVYTVVSVIALGLIYPAAIWLLATVLFHHQAQGSLIFENGRLVGSDLVGQSFAQPGYFHGRPSAAGKGYDPTQTGGTNEGPTNKKLIDATRAAIAALKKENPDATGPIPMDLVTSSASGIDPDVTPEGAYYQAPRVAKARGVSLDVVRALIAAHVTPRTFGILGEPRVNVLALNRALDARTKGAR
ncbi:MAG TPA: potassium-transporting ATPase subunit KdpC [Candidatus Baltobacteraceae bacterium]|nr:potassium-transporting ATPase subunit KdpC [Candidatus Baltobacteraceae bacterium]